MRRPEEEITGLLRRVATLPAGDPVRTALRERAVELELPYALQLARRFHNLGEPMADLGQVAAIGLIKAIDRYDPFYGSGFHAYATPTIVGELKRHFRDQVWSVRVPRRYQDLKRRVSDSREVLTQRLRRAPTVADVAAHLGVEEEQVIEAMVAANGYRSASLDVGTDENETGLFGRLGAVERGYDVVELREALWAALTRLTPREQRIIRLRFFSDRSQTQIADELGISQMHVSRLLARGLRELRRCLDP